MIDRATVEKITDAANIVEVVSDYVHLIRRGSNYVGLCPFHNERTPSFSVNPRRNFCYCFSCKKGGSPVNFIMEKEGLNYHDALLALASKYGIKVEERELTDEERARMGQREAMLVANEWAMKEMENNLTSTEEGRSVGLSYLYERGVSDDAIRKFHLGYALDSQGALVQSAHRKGISQEVLRELGLVGMSQQGRAYDRFRGRVIFPVFNPSGKVVAFGGRDLKGGPAKYINSPESEIYKKSNELYGIYQAKNEIVRQDRCYLVEGYLDVIGMSMAGVENVVASSGTALTEGQIAMIHRFTNRITLIYDGDAAGIKAAFRGMDMLLSNKMDVSLVLLPDGHDPDSFAKTRSPEEFRKYLAEHETDVLRFKAEVLLKESKAEPRKRIEAIKSMVTSLAHIQDETARRVYIQECSRLLQEDPNFIAARTAEVRAGLVESWRRDRQRRREIERIESHDKNTVSRPDTYTPDTPDGSRGPESVEKNSNRLSTHIDDSSHYSNTSDSDDRHLHHVEFEMLMELLRYGQMTFELHNPEMEVTDDRLNEVEYVASELEADEIYFTVPAHSKLFAALESMRPRFIKDRKKFLDELEDKLKSKTREEYDRIAVENDSVEKIRQAELKLTEHIAQIRREMIEDFEIDYAVPILASDPDDEIRRLVSRMQAERTRLKNSPEASLPSGDSLEPPQLITKALLTWKDATVTKKINEITRKMQEAARSNDIASLTLLQKEMLRIVTIRRAISQFIGDRVIDPRIRRHGSAN